ncbi:alpha/beta hydrolase [Amycolatopsis sp. NPDC048633]|uniref:alpha/beta fold hydrolase n=1 Tax=Amycolatopsis sp. NPDC048633 TaxID=3157095 RepID=UPI0033C74DB8
MSTERLIAVNDLSIHITEQGSGPLVILLHGFPETSHSWRHHIGPLADAGHHVVAPDLRGAGGTVGPEAIDQYTILHLVGDVVGLIHALGEEEAVLVGHDWGAIIAWHVALMRPDVVRGVAALSVAPPRRPPAPPMTLAEKRFGRGFYQIYFQEPGVADAELDSNPEDALLGFFGKKSTAVSAEKLVPVVPPGGGILDALDTNGHPDWMSKEDFDAVVAAYARSGFTGGLNWYRNLDRNWELTAPWQDAKITPPSFYVTAGRDVSRMIAPPGFLEQLPEVLTDLRGVLDLDGCGHWIQQERPAEVQEALLAFIAGL